MAKAERGLLADGGDGPRLALSACHGGQGLGLISISQCRFELEGDVEVLDQSGLAAAGDHTELLDTCGAGLLHRVLNQWLVDDGQHFLGGRLGGWQEAGAQAGDGQDGFAQFFDHASTPICNYPQQARLRAEMWRASKPIDRLAQAATQAECREPG
jgi:hypothetical protein